MRKTGSIVSRDAIHWYYEQEGTGPHIVLVPDGLGDCQMFDKSISPIAAQGFTVTTFDMPGMSRSSNAPPETFENVTPQKLASYVIGICDALDIDKATFWGCSSGGSTMLALVADYPDRVRNAMAHEVPTHERPQLLSIVDLPDDEIQQAILHNLPSQMGPMEEWNALGPDFHARVRSNLPRWARGYFRSLGRSFPVQEEALKGRPLDWSISGERPAKLFVDNAITATKLGIPFKCLPGWHFPYVTHSEAFVAYVVETTLKYLEQ